MLKIPPFLPPLPSFGFPPSAFLPPSFVAALPPTDYIFMVTRALLSLPFPSFGAFGGILMLATSKIRLDWRKKLAGCKLTQSLHFI